MVQEILHELEGLPLTFGSNGVSDTQGKEVEDGDPSGSGSYGKRQEDWALVGRSDTDDKRSSVDEGQGNDVLISPSRFSVLADDGEEEDDIVVAEEDVGTEKGEDTNADSDIEEGELVVKEDNTKAKDSTKTARLRTGASFKLSKQIPARGKDPRGKNQSTTRKTSSRKL